MDPLCLGLLVVNHAAALQILASTCRWLVTALRAVGMNTAERRVNLRQSKRRPPPVPSLTVT